jgi:ADP-ribose pyrophosphatase YjhB (NUDIX family)
MAVYNFCYKCGGQLNQESEQLFVCSSCKFHQYLNSKPCVAVILENDQQQVLLGKRKINPHAGTWDLPGGFVDLEENFEQASVRELKEELDITVSADDLHFWGSYIDRYEYMEVNYHLISVVYSLAYDNQKIRPADDLLIADWFGEQAIPWNQIAFESMKQCLRRYLASR